MAHPFKHAHSTARTFGGKPEDYLVIHNWFDESKAFFPGFRHRALRHHAEGIFLCESLFGVVIMNSHGTQVPVRYIGEMHVKEDLGWIPTAQDWLSNIKPQRWMYGVRPGETNQAEDCTEETESSERWRAVTQLYSDFAEIWRVEKDGSLESLIAQIPIDRSKSAEAQHALARRIASLPDLTRALKSAPQPPQCQNASDAERQAVLLNWLATEYIPWFEGQHKTVLSPFEVKT
jgi:hypothetical protein